MTHPEENGRVPEVTRQEVIIEARGLSKRFGRITALDNMNLQIREGEFLTVFGPNGAGKTTLIGILSSLVKATSGEILFQGKSVRENANRLRRSIGMIGHQSLLYGQLTADENLEFYGRMYGVDCLDERVEKVLEEVNLQHRANDLTGTFSRGMMQRLSIARAMIHQPSIYLLDEPYSGLDQHSGDKLRDMLSGLKTQRKTILMTTHDLERGFELSDRSVIIVNGRVEYDRKRENEDVSEIRRIYYRLIEQVERKGL